MSTLITAKIDIKKINPEKLFKGDKGTYLDLTIWINDTPDAFGNDVSIEQRTDKGAKKIYLGNGKIFKAQQQTPLNNTPTQVKESDDLPAWLK